MAHTTAASLYRRHPELFALANTVLDRASSSASRRYAVWFDGGRWQIGPVDGVQFSRSGPDAILAGTYTLAATPEQIVLDILEAQSEIMECAA